MNCPTAQLKLDNLTYRCGCNRTQVEEERQVYYSKRRTHHCCLCFTPQQPEKLYKLEEKLACTACYKTHYESLDPSDPEAFEYYDTGLGRGTLVRCKVCRLQKPRSKMHYLESMQGDLWFCELEHMYAYKVSTDLQYNPNYEIWTRIRHYTESNRSAGSQYDMNQDRIYRLVRVLLEENTQTIEEAMEEQDNDRYSREWTSAKITILLRTEQVELTEEEEATLQQILNESYNTAHPDFDA